MTLSDDIKRVITAVRIDLRGIREIAVRMGHAVPGQAKDAGEIGLRCIDILARLNGLEAGAAAKRMIAEEEPLTPHERDFEHFKHDLLVIGDDTFSDVHDRAERRGA